jgi:uncharacterized protein YecE (DUF72 family)
MPRRVFIGTAGWSVPRASAPKFRGEGTHLQRYARVMPAAEINSSFYRPHAEAVYAKWASMTPTTFRFAVKLPSAITHDLRLRQPRRIDPLIDRFLAETAGLGRRRGPLLVQLPPSLEFDARISARFWNSLRARVNGPIVCEPRHSSWFTPRAEAVLVEHDICRVAADPVRAPGAGSPGGWPGLVYYRLHGSPRTYWSAYTDEYLRELRNAVVKVPRAVDVWVIFDNTASGAALENAWALQTMLGGSLSKQP